MALFKIRIKALITFLFSCLTALVILESCSSEKKKKENLESKINIEDSIDICLTRYDFESARNYLALTKGINKKKLIEIIKSECLYFASQKEFDKAFSNVDELNLVVEDNDDLNDKRSEITKLIILKILQISGTEDAISHLNKMPVVGSRMVRNDAVKRKNELINIIIDELLAQNKFKLAKKLCLELPTQMLEGTYADGKPAFNDIRSEALLKIDEYIRLNSN